MTQTVHLKDPGGHIRATLAAPAGPEALLRAAMGMGDDDRLIVVALDDQTWSLAVFWPGRDIKMTTLDVTCGTVPDQLIAPNRAGMVETAWLALVDDGWTVG